MKFGPVIPILRMFDEALAKAFYADYLGFSIEWQHRFAPDLPLYMLVQRGDCSLHLTGHHGDCCPGASVRIHVEDIDAYHAELTVKLHKHSRPTVELTPWGTCDMQITDPFGNRLTFWQTAAE